MAIEPKKRYAGAETEWRWTCSLCNKTGPWTKDVSQMLDDGEKHGKGEHASHPSPDDGGN